MRLHNWLAADWAQRLDVDSKAAILSPSVLAPHSECSFIIKFGLVYPLPG